MPGRGAASRSPTKAPAKTSRARVKTSVAVLLDARVVPIGALEPNPWIVNVMNDDEYRAARESIRETGFVDPITVRVHPDRKSVV